MNFTKKNIVIYSIITLALLIILLFCDALFLHSTVMGDISKNVYTFFNKYLGSISMILMVTIILFSVVFLFPSERIPRANWLIGISFLLSIIPALLEFLKIAFVTGGVFGQALNGLIVKSGNFAYFIYGVSVFLAFLIFLFPYRYLLSAWAVGLFSNKEYVKPDTNKKENKSFDSVSDYNQDYDLNMPENQVDVDQYYTFQKNSYNNTHKKVAADTDETEVESKKNIPNPPLFTKIVYDTDSRVEYSCFNKNEKPKKFIYDSEDAEFVYFKQQDESAETSMQASLVKHSAKTKNSSDKDYYDKSKEFFPEWWNPEKNKTNSQVEIVETKQSIEADKADTQTGSLDVKPTAVTKSSDNDDEEHIPIENVVTSLDFENNSLISYPANNNITVSMEGKTEFSEPKELEESRIVDIINSIAHNDELAVAQADENDDILIDDEDEQAFDIVDNADFEQDGESWNAVSEPSAEQNDVDWGDALPDTDLLQSVVNEDRKVFEAEEKQAAEILEATLLEFKIKATVSDIIHGPTVTLFKVVPAAGVKLTLIEGLSNNLAMRLSAKSIRIIAPIPGESVVGIEIPNRKRETVSFKEIVDSSDFANNKMNIPIGIGKDIYGNIIMLDMYKMPHILIAGATGAGKSVCVNSFICSILCSRSPEEVRMVLIDPKVVELKPYNDIPHLLTPVITDPKKAINALKYLVFEMERRYSLLGDMGVRDIVEYRNALKTKRANMENLPFIVAFVDEFADLMSTSGKETEMLFARLTAKARAVGILLVLATQRPSTDVITGLIKANVPARISFQVISLQDSRIVLDQKGAEKLLGQGDMLYLSPTQPFPTRVQGAFLSKEEVDALADHWKSIAEPNYINIEEMIADFENEEEGGETFQIHEGGGSHDALFEQALEIARQTGTVSASYLQRRLSIGYNRAANIVESMEDMGMVGPANGSKPREFLG